MNGLFSKAGLRLGLRAVLAGVGAFVVSVQHATGYGTATWKAAAVAGALAALEFFTPLNALVGLPKQPAAKPPAVPPAQTP